MRIRWNMAMFGWTTTIAFACTLALWMESVLVVDAVSVPMPAGISAEHLRFPSVQDRWKLSSRFGAHSRPVVLSRRPSLRKARTAVPPIRAVESDYNPSSSSSSSPLRASNRLSSTERTRSLGVADLHLDALPSDPRMLEQDTVRRLANYWMLRDRYHRSQDESTAFTLPATLSWELQRMFMAALMDRLARFLPPYHAFLELPVEPQTLLWLWKHEGSVIPFGLAQHAAAAVQKQLDKLISDALLLYWKGRSAKDPSVSDAKSLTRAAQEIKQSIEYKQWERKQIREQLDQFPREQCRETLENLQRMLESFRFSRRTAATSSKVRNKEVDTQMLESFPLLLQYLNNLRNCGGILSNYDQSNPNATTETLVDMEGSVVLSWEPWDLFYLAERYFVYYRIRRTDEVDMMAHLTYAVYHFSHYFRGAERIWPNDVLQLLQDYESPYKYRAECQWISLIVAVQMRLVGRHQRLLHEEPHHPRARVSSATLAFDVFERSLYRPRAKLDHVLENYHAYSAAQWNTLMDWEDATFLGASDDDDEDQGDRVPPSFIRLEHYQKLVVMIYQHLDRDRNYFHKLMDILEADSVRFGVTQNREEWLRMLREWDS